MRSLLALGLHIVIFGNRTQSQSVPVTSTRFSLFRTSLPPYSPTQSTSNADAKRRMAPGGTEADLRMRSSKPAGSSIDVIEEQQAKAHPPRLVRPAGSAIDVIAMRHRGAAREGGRTEAREAGGQLDRSIDRRHRASSQCEGVITEAHAPLSARRCVGTSASARACPRGHPRSRAKSRASTRGLAVWVCRPLPGRRAEHRA